jgi:hypothetical protein
MRQKLDVGTLMLAIGALLVLIALFLDWYTPGGTAWQSFEITDLLLAVMAATAIVLALRRLAVGESGTPGWIQGLAVAALVVVAAEQRGEQARHAGWCERESACEIDAPQAATLRLREVMKRGEIGNSEAVNRAELRIGTHVPQRDCPTDAQKFFENRHGLLQQRKRR